MMEKPNNKEGKSSPWLAGAFVYNDAFVIPRPEGLSDDDWKVLSTTFCEALRVGAQTLEWRRWLSQLKKSNKDPFN